MRVYAPQAAKPVRRHTGTPKVRHLDLLRRPDHHILDLPLTVEQNAHLPIGLVRDLGHLPCKFRRYDLVRSYATCCEAFDTLKLVMLQPLSEAVDVTDRNLSSNPQIITN